MGGAITWLDKADGRYAKANTVESVAETVYEVEKDLECHKIEVRMRRIQERMWALDDYWGTKFYEARGRYYQTLEELIRFMTQEARDQYRALQEEYRALEKRLAELEKEKNDG